MEPEVSTTSTAMLSESEERAAYVGEQRLVDRMRALGISSGHGAAVDDLKAEFVDDDNIEDGQVFPAGAEFVKNWRLQNTGNTEWPDSTNIIFVAGDRMPAFEGAPLSYYVGRVEAGEYAYACAMDLKAPEVPGQYVGYWRLVDGNGIRFGSSVWCK